MTSHSVSVIIPTRDKLPRLRLTLAALLSHASHGTEIIIVDDGSTDGTGEYLSTQKGIRQVRLPGRGRSTARNEGALAANGEILLFLDDDMLTATGFVNAHCVQLIERGRKAVTRGTIRTLSEVKFFADPVEGRLYTELGLATDRKLAAIRSLGLRAESISESISLLEKRSRLTVHEKMSHKCLSGVGEYNCPWVAIAGANLGMWKSQFTEVGGFDPAFDPYWGGEDIELGIRLSGGGCEFIHVHEAFGLHLQHYRPDGDVQLRAAFGLIQEKHPGIVASWVLESLLNTFPCSQNTAPRLDSCGDEV